MGGVACTSSWRSKQFIYKLAMLPGRLLWVRQLRFEYHCPLSSCQENLFLFLLSIFMHRGRIKLLHSVHFFMETVPEKCCCTNRMKSPELSFEFISAAHVQIFATKRTQRRVNNPWINSSTVERNNCRSLR